jgi:dephospho-CoA kinase
MKTYIGLVGEKGSGKDTFSHMLTGLLAHKTLTRSNLQEIAIVLDKGFGAGTVTHGVYEKMKNSPAEIVIFDGIRWKTDVEMLRMFENNILIYITAPLETRFERTKLRKEKMDESMTSMEQFVEEESIATEVEIPVIAKEADVVIDNSGDLDKLQTQVKDFCAKMSS